MNWFTPIAYCILVYVFFCGCLIGYWVVQWFKLKWPEIKRVLQ